jgi:hypothetical protein
MTQETRTGLINPQRRVKLPMRPALEVGLMPLSGAAELFMRPVPEGDLAKAKESPSFRFCALYDKVYRPDVLRFPYDCCKVNGGAAGVDGQTFEDIEAYGAERWLDELTQELKDRTYRPFLYGESGFRSRTGRSSGRWAYPLSATG